MPKSAKILSLIILTVSGVIGVTAGIWYVLDTNGDSEAPVSALGSEDYPVPKDLDELARMSDYIISGTVTKEDYTTRQVLAGERGPVFEPTIISTVQINEVMKGPLEESQITVGQAGIEEDPAPPVGSQVIFFLRKIYHSVARHPIPYDYFSSAGPQAVFLIDFESNKTTPLGIRYAPTTERYQGADVAQFLDEVRQAAARNPYPRATLSPQPK